MKVKFVGTVVVLVALASGCVGHYRYESRGIVFVAENQQANAVMYWFGDDGRMWYGSRYRQTDTDIEMNVCGMTSKSFEPAGEEQSSLQLLSRSGDQQVAAPDDAGNVIRLPEPKPLRPGSECGRVAVGQAKALTDDLQPGVEPDVIILCENVQKSERYPDARLYEFQAVVRVKVKENEPPATNCPGAR